MYQNLPANGVMVLVVMHQWTLALLHLTMDQAVEAVPQAWSTAGYVVAPLVVPVIIVMDMVARHLSLQMLGKKSSQASRCWWLLWLALKKSPFDGGTSFQVHLLEKQCQQRLLNYLLDAIWQTSCRSQVSLICVSDGVQKDWLVVKWCRF